MTIEGIWKYEASGNDLGTGWREAGFDDSGWASGSAPLFTGDFRSGFGEVRAIPTLFNSGIGTNGTALAAGSPDPHYRMTVPAQTTNAALVIQNNAAWMENSLVSSWIGPVNPGSGNAPAGAYKYVTRFDLCRFDPATVQVSLNVAVDDSMTNLFLNGVSTSNSFTGFAAFSPPILLTNGFVAGTNTIDFRVLNAGSTANSSGFRVEAAGTGLTILTNTAVAAGATTYYFRSTFGFAEDPASTTLTLHPVASDGAVFYLNGTEILRLNMPDGPITASTFASSSAGDAGYSGPFTLPGNSLVTGTNVLAVEVHRAANPTNNMILGLELSTSTTFPEPPRLALTKSRLRRMQLFRLS